MDESAVGYTCKGCGSKFPAKQGSRRRYCDQCLVSRMLNGAKKSPVKKGNSDG